MLIALNLYYKLPFAKYDRKTPAVIEVSKRLGRTPSSLAMKLVNLASLDPTHQMRGAKGLSAASELDRTMWAEFHENLNESVPASQAAMEQLFHVDPNTEVEVLPKEGIRVHRDPPSGPTDILSNVKLRRGQNYFRNAVLNNFDSRCGITQLAIRELLIASHILPWGTHTEHRLNVRNGICLSRLHDAAFDQGLIGFDDDLKLLLSPRIKTAGISQKIVADNFLAFEGEPLRLPVDAKLPELAFLAAHRSQIFMR